MCSDLQYVPICSPKPFHKETCVTPISVIISDIIFLGNTNLKNPG